MRCKNSNVLKASAIISQSILFYLSTPFVVVVGGVGFLIFEFLFHRDVLKAKLTHLSLKKILLKKVAHLGILCGSLLFSTCMLLSMVPFLAVHSASMQLGAFCGFIFRNGMIILSKHRLISDKRSSVDADRYVDILFSIYGIFCLVGFTYQIPFWTNFILSPAAMAFSGLIFLYMVCRSLRMDSQLEVEGDVTYERVNGIYASRMPGRGYDGLLPLTYVQAQNERVDNRDSFSTVLEPKSSIRLMPTPMREEKHESSVVRKSREDGPSWLWYLG